MQTIKLPSGTGRGSVKIFQILIFSTNKALILGEHLNTEKKVTREMWCFFNPETGEIIPNE